MKKILISILFIIILSNFSFAHELLNSDYNDYKGLSRTVREASELTKSGNPMDFVIAYKEDNNNKIDSDYLNPLEFEEEDPNISDYAKSMMHKINKATDIMISNIKNDAIPKTDIGVREVKGSLKSRVILAASIILLILVIILYVFKRKTIYIIVSAILIVVGCFSFIKSRQVVSYSNDNISNYALTGEINDHLSKNIESNENKEKILNYMNQKWCIASFVNDYFTRVDACTQLQKNNEKLNKNIYMFRFQENDSKNKSNYFNELPLFKYGYEFKHNGDILCNGFSFNDLQILCNNIKNDGVINYSKDKISNSLNDVLSYSNYDNNEKLYNYLNRVANYTLIVGDEQDYFDNKVISYFKDWYIEGMEDKDIDLPYGATLHYEAPKFVKKDIKEVLYTNESELDHNSKERQVYVMYYKDSKGELKGTYTDVEFVKTGSDYIIDFNPYELLYDLKKPVATLTIE